ncbi:MAG: response regulator transcription factor [Bdellovibrionales bacterium]|nr:response regulator transcription factor [Bdellovibrionales bacterium]
MAEKLTLLLVEDEEAILQGLIDVFVYHGYEVDAARDGAEGLQKARSGRYDLIILDVMLPNVDGFTICNEIRMADGRQPIIMLTAKTTDEDIINGLSLGADDYVGKPFSVRQLVLRVEAVLRRSDKIKRLERELVLGPLTIDTANLVGHTPTQPGTAIPFTRREIDLLRYLLEHSERPVSREELLEEVWGYARASQVETRTVDIHVAKLRRKIEADPKNPSVLMTVRGEGYRLGTVSQESE